MRFLIVFLLGMLFASVASNSDIDWVNAIMNSIANTDQLQSMLLNSGKGINDLGNIDAWDTNPNTKYVVFKVAGPFIRIGLWLPKKWNQENMEIIRTAIESLFMRLKKSGSMCQTSIPSEEKPTVAVGNIIGFIFFGALFLTWILGMIVEYTNLFGEQKWNEYESLSEAAKDKELIQ